MPCIVNSALLAAAATAMGQKVLGIPAEQLLGLSVLGAIVSAFGSLTGILIKEVWVARSSEKRKSRQTIEDVYRRYQLPIFLAAQELSGRFYGLSRDGSGHLKRESNFGLDQIRKGLRRGTEAAVDDHYLHYRFVSNAYRLCGFLGWVELYRRDIGTMDIAALGLSRDLESTLQNIQSSLADGQLNQHETWSEWRDCLLFREELRAIGNSMIADKDKLCILDFGSFTQIMEDDPEGKAAGRWLVQAAHFFDHLRGDKDFRLVRMRMLVVHLTELMEMLQPGRIPRHYVSGAKAFDKNLDDLAGGTRWRGPKARNIVSA